MLWRASLFIILFFAFCPARLVAQEAATNHNVILRRDPTTSSPALEHLTKGARLTLVDALPDSGFYHVKTEDDRVGWIFAKYVSSEEYRPSRRSRAPTPPGTAAAVSASTKMRCLYSAVYVRRLALAATSELGGATSLGESCHSLGSRLDKD